MRSVPVPADREPAADQILTRLPEIMRLLATGTMLRPPDLDLTVGQLRLVNAVREAESLSMGAVSGALGISLPAASEVVDRLVREGIVRRTADPRDRRVVLISLTRKGTQAAQRCHRARRAGVLTLLSQLDLTECADLVSHLDGIVSLLQQAHERTANDGAESVKP